MIRRITAIFVVAAPVVIVVDPQASAWGHGTTERVSVRTGGVQANRESSDAAISGNGRFVAFTSGATNLVSGDTNTTFDVFVRDRKTATTERASLGQRGVQGDGASLGATLSADGRIVAFLSASINLVRSDSNGQTDAFARDRLTGMVWRVSVGTDGTQADSDTSEAAISANGRFVAFTSGATGATNLVSGGTNFRADVFLHDRRTLTTRRVSVGPNNAQADGSISFDVAISADGRFVAYTSDATNLVPGDTNGQPDVFAYDRMTQTTRRVSIGSGAVQANSGAAEPAISANGRFVAFISESTNLVRGDTNRTFDVFVHDRKMGTTERVSLGKNGAQSNGISQRPVISADGRFVAFKSYATNLVAGDTNGQLDVFVHDRQTHTTRRVSIGSNSILIIPFTHPAMMTR